MSTSLQQRRRPILITLLIVVVAALLAWGFFSQRNGAADPNGGAAAGAERPGSGQTASGATRRTAGAAGATNATPVVAARAARDSDDVMVEVIGSGLAASSVTIFPATTGEVARVLFSSGQRVAQDQALIRLTERSERLAVELAEARADAARRLLRRYERTQKSGAVSANVIDEARLALRQAEIEVAQARERLRERTIRAPFDGVVGIAQVDPGERVAPDTALTTLDNRAQLSVAFQVPETYLGRLARGQTVVLRSVVFPGREFEGTLSHIDSRVDPETRTVSVRATVPNEDDLLRPGMAFSVRLALPGPAVIRVPELAVQWGREGSHVWAVRDAAAVQVPVRMVRRLEGAVLVDGAIAPGELVVVEGFHRLRPGRAVRIIQEQQSERQQEQQQEQEQPEQTEQQAQRQDAGTANPAAASGTETGTDTGAGERGTR